mmetsp:Transcript_38572/g.81043  ORF Transcript_38572/g.81043 Transcript_38572/m.81043 type:complete len:109 (+) Transcript_38572:210-536(+)
MWPSRYLSLLRINKLKLMAAEYGAGPGASIAIAAEKPERHEGSGCRRSQQQGRGAAHWGWEMHAFRKLVKTVDEALGWPCGDARCAAQAVCRGEKGRRAGDVVAEDGV